MAEIIQLFNSLSPTKVDGYSIPFSLIIKRYHEHARWIGEPDVFVVKHYANSGRSTELMRGHDPEDRPGYIKKIVATQDAIAGILDKLHSEAKLKIEKDQNHVFKWREEETGIAVIFIKCQDGIIGSGWYENTKTIPKAQKLAAFVLYAIGYLNADYDTDFFDVSYNILPYAISSFGRCDVAEDIIESAIEELQRDRFKKG